MKYQLFQYQESAGGAKVGIQVGGVAYDVPGSSISELLDQWPEREPELSAAAQRIAAGGATDSRLRTAGLRMLAPVPATATIYAAGANYRDHVEAMARVLKTKLTLDPRSDGIPPWHFIKPGRATLAGHGQEIPFPEGVNRLDWEAELAVIIGRRARNVTIANALSFVAGYSCANDLSARDVFVRQAVDSSSPFHFDWVGHKCFTGSCPIGPFLTPSAYVASPENLGIRLWVNDVLRQDGNTSNHLYGVAEQIEYLSRRFELFPGDVILTGTPAGVGMETGMFLQRGDRIRVEVDGLGVLENTLA